MSHASSAVTDRRLVQVSKRGFFEGGLGTGASDCLMMRSYFLAGDRTDRHRFRCGKQTGVGDVDRFLSVGRAWIETTLAPPRFGFAAGVAGVLDADEFALPMIEADHVVDSQASRCVFVGVAFAMDAIDDVLDVVVGVGDFARQHAGLACLGIVGFAIRWRERMTALGTVGVAACDQGVTLLALFRRRILVGTLWLCPSV